MKLFNLLKESLTEGEKKKPSSGLSKEKKSDIVKQAKKGKDFGKKGKGFKDVVAKAKKSKAKDPEAVAGAAFWKNIKRVKEGEDHEVSMAQNSLKSIMQSCADLMNKLGDEERNLPGWIQDHISNAENFIDQAAQGFHELGDHEEEDKEESGDDTDMIQPVDEKKLTKEEQKKKEEIIKAIAKNKGGKEKLKGKEYAIATAQAIKSAE